MRRIGGLLLLVFFAQCYGQKTCDAFDFACSPLAALTFAPPWMGVAVGTGCQGWYSVNQRDWRAFTFPGCTTGTISGIAYGAGRFVAVGSTNGTTCGIWTGAGVFAPQWEQQSCGPASVRMSAVAFGSGLAGSEFVAAGVPSGANFNAVSSLDGITWSDALITEAGAGGAVISLVFWDTAGLFVESSGTPQNTRRRSIGGGTNWLDGDNMGVTNPRLAAGPVVNGNRRILGVGNSPSVVQYSDDAFTSGAVNYSPNIFGAALPVANDLAYGEGKRFVFVRDSCGVTVSASDSGADTSGLYTMSACATSNLKAVAYVEPFFVAGADDGFFYYSSSGLPQEWTRAAVSTAGTVQRIAGRPGL